MKGVYGTGREGGDGGGGKEGAEGFVRNRYIVQFKIMMSFQRGVGSPRTC